MRQKTNRPPKKSVPSAVCRCCPALFCVAVSILRCLLLFRPPPRNGCPPPPFFAGQPRPLQPPVRPRGKKKKVSEAAASETFAGCGCRREGRCYPSRPAVCQKRVWLLSSCCRAGRSGCPSRMRACERAASVMRLPESILAISVVRSSAVSRVMEVRPSRL